MPTEIKRIERLGDLPKGARQIPASQAEHYPAERLRAFIGAHPIGEAPWILIFLIPPQEGQAASDPPKSADAQWNAF